ncbi:phosphatase PAP2 family protein [Spirosoma sp. BT702]|uniref:Phosphatase PAP2 family protein n=1 Tax=Spirosoma profusum TaxID=2771354 RepID=A0A926Y092_9BACT|nr:phosphatase PAP2 family protein [Spirosoma profusum]MBD2701522.1 phosphatase PAP2 family protein [Spirosoma profusum]
MVKSFRNNWQEILKKKRIGITLFIIHYSLFITPLSAQSPYELRTGREITLLGVGAATLGGSFALAHNIDPLTQAEISVLKRADVNSFDQKATYQWSTTADKLSDVTLAGTIGITGLLTIGTKPMRQDLKTVAVMYIETMLLANGVKGMVKAVTQRTRPFVYNPDAPLADKLERDARQSFFSGHATNAFATAVFTGEVFRHYFPHSKLKPVVWVGSLGLATATAVLRYEGGLHYPSDLLAGAAFGTLVGWGIPKLHEVKKQTALGRRLDIQPWSNGAANGIYVQLSMFSR